MKNLYFFFFLTSALLLKAQQSNLTSHTWYLQKIIYSNGTESIAPNNTEVTKIPTNFGDTQMDTDVVNDFLAFKFGGNAITSSTISYDEFWYPPNSTGCQIPENCVFQNNYYFFLGYGFPMSYEITSENNYLKLILTNNNGNQAVYLSQNLSINEIEKSDFKIYPNPVKDILHLSTKLVRLNVEIFDVQGKLILSKKLEKSVIRNNFEIDISGLNNGIYLLVIDNKIVSKIIKE
ncbi:MAG: T9SS type A sorting domain-containing protein [Lutibacter sp.]